MLDQNEIGKYLRKLRLERNWTQAQLAEQLNVSNRSVSRWETGATMPDLPLLIEISELYGVSVDAILNFGQTGNAENTKADPQNAAEPSGTEQKKMEENKTIAKAAELVSRQEEKVSRRMKYLFAAGLLCIAVFALIDLNQLTETEPWNSIASICMGFVTGILMTGLLYTSAHSRQIASRKARLFRK